SIESSKPCTYVILDGKEHRRIDRREVHSCRDSRPYFGVRVALVSNRASDSYMLSAYVWAQHVRSRESAMSQRIPTTTFAMHHAGGRRAAVYIQTYSTSRSVRRSIQCTAAIDMACTRQCSICHQRRIVKVCHEICYQ